MDTRLALVLTFLIVFDFIMLGLFYFQRKINDLQREMNIILREMIKAVDEKHNALSDFVLGKKKEEKN